MTEKMKAARFYEVGKPLRIDKISIPKLGPGDVLVEINNLGRLNETSLFSKNGNWCILEGKKMHCDNDTRILMDAAEFSRKRHNDRKARRNGQ